MLYYDLIKNKNVDKYLVMLHCICADRTVFNNTLHKFKEHFNIIIIDLPYHGNSMEYMNKLDFKLICNNIIEILDKNNIKQANFIGLSLGSCVSSYMCYYYPERIEKVILASNANSLSNKLYNVLFAIFTKINMIIPKTVYLKVLIYCIIPQKQNLYYRKLFLSNALNMPKGKIREWLKLLSQHFRNCNKFLQSYLNNCNLPKLYLMGKNDFVFKTGIIKKVVENENSNVLLLKNKSHMLDIDSDDIFSKLCINFLVNVEKQS